jgi:microcystin-dependent protein
MTGEVDIPSLGQNRRRTRTYDRMLSNEEAMLAALRASLTPPGAIIATMAETQPDTNGYKLCDGQSLSKAEYPSLFAVLGGRFGETDTTFALPDLRGRTVFGAGGAQALSLGQTGGADAVQLTVGQLPAHDHGVTDPGHTHTFTGAPHTHGVTDPGHTHEITDPGHSHSAPEDLGGAVMGGMGGDEMAPGDTGESTTGVTVDSATTGVSVDAATAGGTNAIAATGMTVEPTGAGEPVPIIPPVIAVNWLMRT